jgi:hypothetical protein
MKSLKLIAVWMGLATGSVAFAQGSETRNVGDFTGIMASGETRVEITQAENCSVELVGNAEGLKNVVTEVRNGILEIRGGTSKNLDGGILAKVSVKNLNKIQLSGAAVAKCMNQVVTDTLKINGSGAAQFDLVIKAKRLEGVLSGATAVKASGDTEALSIVGSGVSSFKGYNLIAEDAQVVTSGAASARVHASKKLNLTATGASDIKYTGSATEKVINASSASTITVKGNESKSGDTTNVRIGDRTVSIVDDGNDDRSPREKKSNDDDFEHWAGLDFGVNGLLSAQNKVDLPNGFDYLELNYAKSYVFGWNAWQKNIHIVKNYVNLGTGIGATWYHYNFRNAYTLTPNVPYAVATFDSTYNFSRNRLNVAYLNVPLFLEFNTNNNNADRSFHIAVGGQFGYNIFKNKVKQKYEFEGETYKRKVKDDFNVNPFKYDLIARIGYGKFTMFGTYSLSTLFESGRGPVVYPFTAGISLNL